MLRTHRFNIRLNDHEYDYFCTESAKAGLSLSDYFRVVLMRKPVPSIQTSKELLSVNRDLANLGNLQKLCIHQLADTPTEEHKELIAELNDLKNDIRSTQAALKAKILKIKI